MPRCPIVYTYSAEIVHQRFLPVSPHTLYRLPSQPLFPPLLVSTPQTHPILMTQRAPILTLPPLQRRAPLPRPQPRQKPVPPLPHKMRRAERIPRAAANLDAREGRVCADFGKEVEEFAAACRRGSGAVEGGEQGGRRGARCEADCARRERWA